MTQWLLGGGGGVVVTVTTGRPWKCIVGCQWVSDGGRFRKEKKNLVDK